MLMAVTGPTVMRMMTVSDGEGDDSHIDGCDCRNEDGGVGTSAMVVMQMVMFFVVMMTRMAMALNSKIRWAEGPKAC